VFRIHCSHCEPRVWVYPNAELLGATYKLRNSLVPYIYTAAHAAATSGLLLLRPLYYEWPEEEHAYGFSTFGGGPPRAVFRHANDQLADQISPSPRAEVEIKRSPRAPAYVSKFANSDTCPRPTTFHS
jgi:hypothetical protein